MRKFYGNKNQARILKQIAGQTKRLNKMIETKDAQWKTYPNAGFTHNQVHVLKTDAAGVNDLNPFYIVQGAGDPMAQNQGNRIGDKITLKGMKIVGFFENALSRPKVYYRLMLIKCSKGDSITRATLFQNCSDNKMIDTINTERFTIIAQKIFNVTCANAGPTGVNAAGEIAGWTLAGNGTKVIRMWVPGRKFGKYGNVQYENGINGQVKFFDYRLVLVCYDWYGTPQDVNTVGKINELYTKVYFKDA